jgi:hypothetical protein
MAGVASPYSSQQAIQMQQFYAPLNHPGSGQLSPMNALRTPSAGRQPAQQQIRQLQGQQQQQKFQPQK